MVLLAPCGSFPAHSVRATCAELNGSSKIVLNIVKKPALSSLHCLKQIGFLHHLLRRPLQYVSMAESWEIFNRFDHNEAIVNAVEGKKWAKLASKQVELVSFRYLAINQRNLFHPGKILFKINLFAQCQSFHQTFLMSGSATQCEMDSPIFQTNNSLLFYLV